MANQNTKFLVTASELPHLNQVTQFLLKILFFVQNEIISLFPNSPHVHIELLTIPSNGDIFVSLLSAISTLKVSLYVSILLMIPLPH